MASTIGVIGGSGIYESLVNISERKRGRLHTRYGVAHYEKGRCVWSEEGNRTGGTAAGEAAVVFIARHSAGHGTEMKLPPHRVNCRANIQAMKNLGVDTIISTSAVGTLNPKVPVGKIVLPDQMLDLSGGVHTFFEGHKDGVAHVDLTEPFCPHLRRLLNDAAKRLGYPVHTGGTYGSMRGPAFETAAEVRMLQRLGADLAGMTVAPEAKLARERGICYQPVCLPVNWGAGMKREALSHHRTLQEVDRMKFAVVRLIEVLIPSIGPERECACRSAVQLAGGGGG